MNRQCKLADGSVKHYDACGKADHSGTDKYHAENYDYIGSGVIHSICDIRQTGIGVYKFYRLKPPCQKFTNHAAYIDAMQATIKKYGEAIGEGEWYEGSCYSCAICIVASEIEGRVGKAPSSCSTCPWKVITKSTCLEYKPDQYAQRILDLQDWIKQYAADAKLPVKQEEKVWEPEAGEMVEVCDSEEFKHGVWEEKFHCMVSGKFVTEDLEGEVVGWTYARPTRATK